MNNFKRQEVIDELEVGYSKRELAAMVLDLIHDRDEVKRKEIEARFDLAPSKVSFAEIPTQFKMRE